MMVVCVCVCVNAIGLFNRSVLPVCISELFQKNDCREKDSFVQHVFLQKFNYGY